MTGPESLYQRSKDLDKKVKKLKYECFKNKRDSYVKQKCHINGSENFSVPNLYFIEAFIILI